MSEKNYTPDFWSVYKTINFKKFSKNKEFYDPKSGKMYSYHFVGADKILINPLMQVFTMVLWMSPVLCILLLSFLHLPYGIHSYFLSIFAIIAYHFIAMYYIISGPCLVYTEKTTKKKGFFRR